MVVFSHPNFLQLPEPELLLSAVGSFITTSAIFSTAPVPRPELLVWPHIFATVLVAIALLPDAASPVVGVLDPASDPFV